MPLLEADLLGTIRSFASAADLSNPTFSDHSERVAFISYRIGEELGLPHREMEELLQSALLHDIGIATGSEQLKLADLEPLAGHASAHCHRGYELLQQTRLFAPFAKNVLHHHDYYSPELALIPAILHLADRVDIQLDKKRYALWQQPDILHYVESKKGVIFRPDVVEAFGGLAKVPSFWLDLEHGNYGVFRQEHNFRKVLTIDELEEIAGLLATLVDSKSPFTANHSRGVANLAYFLAQQLNMSEANARLVKIAGLLHDLGKLSISDDILLYHGKLDRQQRAKMQQHTYHSYHLISQIGPGAERLAGWAAFHHEHLDGTGYPFALTADKLDQEARLMAIADITRSLLEDRPYRAALGKAKVVQILRNSSKANYLDPDLTDITISLLPEIIELIKGSENPLT